MGIFSFFKKGKKKSQQEVAAQEAQYEAELNPFAQEPTQPEPMPLESKDSAQDTPPTQAPEEARNEAASLQASAEPEPAQPAPQPIAQEAPEPVALSASPAPAAPEAKSGLFGRLKKAVSKTRMVLNRKVAGLIGLGQKIDEDLLDELEEALIEADLGVDTTEYLIDDIRRAWKNGEIETGDEIFPFLKADLKHRLTHQNAAIAEAESGPTVVLVVGVNGAGKTTSIAKMARIFVKEGRKVMLAAADTFRAAAVDQLVTWSGRIGCEIVTGKPGIDPASVAYQGCERALAENADVLIIDTAGRLHTQKDLMEELSKIVRVIRKQIPGAPHETIMVLDATTGQNAVTQARMFRESADVTGIFLAKLDGTAKGGAVLNIDREIGIPVKFVGLGETFEDVQRFSPHAFVDALFDLESMVGAES